MRSIVALALLALLCVAALLFRPAAPLLALCATALLVLLARTHVGRLLLRHAARRELVTTLGTGVIVLDRAGRIVGHNAAAAALAGLTRPGVGQNLADATRDHALGALLQGLLATTTPAMAHALPGYRLAAELHPLAMGGRLLGALLLLQPAARSAAVADDSSAQLAQIADQLGRVPDASAQRQLDLLARQAGELLDANMVALGMRDIHLDDMAVVAGYWPEAASMTGRRVAWPAALVAARAHTTMPTLFVAPLRDAQLAPLQDLLPAEQTQTLVILPLLSNNEPIGLLLVASARTLAFDQHALDMLRVLGTYAGLLMTQQRLAVAALQAERAKSTLLDTISHEFRTPITAILGFAELYQEHMLGPVSSEQSEALEAIERNTRRLLRLVDNLLDLARLEAGSLELTPAPVDVELCLREAQTLLAPQLAARQALLRLTVAAGLPFAWADAIWLRRALINIVAFTSQVRAAGVTEIYAQVTARATHSAQVDELRIEIGPLPGDPTQDAIDYFEVFQPTENGMHAMQATARIGLAISRRAIAAMGGTLVTERAPGLPEQFVLTLRAAGQTPAQRAREAGGST